MSLIVCTGRLCQTSAGCICERQLRPGRIVLDLSESDLPTLMRREAQRTAVGGYFTPAGSLLTSGAEEIERLRKHTP